MQSEAVGHLIMHESVSCLLIFFFSWLILLMLKTRFYSDL